jgi:RNA polymerase subunit RPABC4/transcription elongation factor Spt4
MKYIKNFEGFDFGQTLPATSVNVLTNYYSCDECDALWKEFNNKSETCKYCGSDEVEDIHESEWYELVKSRLDEDEVEDLENQRKKESETLVDLLSLKNKNNYGN